MVTVERGIKIDVQSAILISFVCKGQVARQHVKHTSMERLDQKSRVRIFYFNGERELHFQARDPKVADTVITEKIWYWCEKIKFLFV